MLVYYGYNPRCTAKDVVTGVASALLQRSFRHLTSGAGAAAAAAAASSAAAGAAGAAAPAPAGGGGGVLGALRGLVEEVRREAADRHVFVVIHNLDGPGEGRGGGRIHHAYES